VRAAALAFSVLASSCVQSDVVATFGVSFCDGGGPVIEVGDGRCGGDLARRVFRFAICTCEAFVASAAVTADAFDSRVGPYSSGPGGALGVNGRLDLGQPTTIGGVLMLGDSSGMNAGAGARLEIAQHLASAGPVVSEAEVVVHGNLLANGRVVARDLSVGGTLTVPEGATVEVSGTLDAPEPTRAPVSVAAPCDCAQGAFVDIPAEVDARRLEHDDERAGLGPESLAHRNGQVDLPCGNYFFERISSSSDLTIHATGRVAIFVAGDVAVAGRLAVTLAPNAEVDLLIAGQLVANVPPEIGAEDRPTAARVYIGGAGTIQLGGGSFYGNLYAPRAELVTSGPMEVFGALFARRIAATGTLTSHFDRAIEAAAGDCPPLSDSTCASCLDCRTGGCVDGVCAACTTDAHCCAPQVCRAGACISDWEP
jgi:hypothetical protein